MALWQQVVLMVLLAPWFVSFSKLLLLIAKRVSSRRTFWAAALTVFACAFLVEVGLLGGIVRAVRMCPHPDDFLARRGVAASPESIGFRINEEDIGLLGVRCTAMLKGRVLASHSLATSDFPLTKLDDFVFANAILFSYLPFFDWSSRAFWGSRISEDPLLYWGSVADPSRPARWAAARAGLAEPWSFQDFAI
jgi:hypothetical protein